MSDVARGHRGRHSGRVHGRVFPLPIVPSVIYGSTLSVAPAHNPSKVRELPDMMSAWEEGVMEKLA